MLMLLKNKNIRFALIIFLLFEILANLIAGSKNTGIISNAFAAKKKYSHSKKAKISKKSDLAFPVIVKEDKYDEEKEDLEDRYNEEKEEQENKEEETTEEEQTE